MDQQRLEQSLQDVQDQIDTNRIDGEDFRDFRAKRLVHRKMQNH